MTKFTNFLNKKIVLLLIIALAIFLRFYMLGGVPPSLDWDEVAYGYNAYSLLHTGKDEHGVNLPIVLRSFDDYKPALYSYLAIPSIGIFGLDSFAVRFPNAIFSVIGVAATYFLVRKLFKNENIALLSSFFMAVSPWQIQFTRFSHEATVAVTLNILAVYFFLSSFRKHWQILLSVIFFGLTFYSYQSEKIFVPILGLLLLLIYFRDWIKMPRKFLLSAFFVFLLILLPLMIHLLGDRNALSRARGTSIFSHQTEVLEDSARKLIQDQKENDIVGLIIHNRRVIYAERIVENYLSHFNPTWLFLSGDLPRHHPPSMGVLLIWEFIFILLGIFYLARSKLEKKHKFLIFSWFLVAPIPAMITYDVPHAGRTMNFLPVFQIFTAFGLLTFLQLVKNKFKAKVFLIFVIFISLLFILNFAYYLRQYFSVMSKKYSSEWQYGYKQAVSFLANNQSDYEKIIVSNQVPLDQSYIFFLFYLKYPPDDYQKNGSNKEFSNFDFKKIDWEKDSRLKDVLIVGSPKDIPESVKKIKVFNYLNGEPAILIAKTGQ